MNGIWDEFTEEINIELCPLTGIVLGQRFSIHEFKKCECGMDVTYGVDNELHSEWCPLYCTLKK